MNAAQLHELVRDLPAEIHEATGCHVHDGMSPATTKHVETAYVGAILSWSLNKIPAGFEVEVRPEGKFLVRLAGGPTVVADGLLKALAYAVGYSPRRSRP